MIIRVRFRWIVHSRFDLIFFVVFSSLSHWIQLWYPVQFISSVNSSIHDVVSVTKKIGLFWFGNERYSHRNKTANKCLWYIFCLSCISYQKTKPLLSGQENVKIRCVLKLAHLNFNRIVELQTKHRNSFHLESNQVVAIRIKVPVIGIKVTRNIRATHKASFASSANAKHFNDKRVFCA